ncbi:hypothetical protein C8R42DRAFT_723401 [Lentinula raphanica]|nr:hypothetical protein C8R42DRAFT_723401 [Lentinula raphanica]
MSNSSTLPRFSVSPFNASFSSSSASLSRIFVIAGPFPLRLVIWDDDNHPSALYRVYIPFSWTRVSSAFSSSNCPNINVLAFREPLRVSTSPNLQVPPAPYDYLPTVHSTVPRSVWIPYASRRPLLLVSTCVIARPRRVKASQDDSSSGAS